MPGFIGRVLSNSRPLFQMKSRIGILPIIVPLCIYFCGIFIEVYKICEHLRETYRSYSPEVSAFVHNLIMTKKFMSCGEAK